MADITYNIEKDFGNIGGHKELKLMSWNGNEARYDIRDWYEDRAGKGVALSLDELKSLYSLLDNIFGDDDTKEDDTDWLTDDTETDDDDEYPDNVQKAFKELDKLFDGFTTEKAYGKMPFADNDRLQYFVKKSKKSFPAYEKTLTKLKVNSFITDKGNLYIYTL